MKAAIMGKKLGMTSLFKENGVHVPCTVVEAGPCPVVQVKDMAKDGYKAVQVGFQKVEPKQAKKRLNKPIIGHFDKANTQPMKHLCEFRDLDKEFNIGEELRVEQFAKGDKVRVTGTSKGHGFQGVVKRHHFGGVGMITHGQSDRVRAPGSIGSSSYPSRVFKGLKMGGRMGGKTASVRNLEIVDVIPEQNIIMIKGSVPGPMNSLLKIVKL
ncbi:MAG: rplC [Ignavibacteria bacterium]|nr:rplC [Ignavibacteria bacterium]